AWADGASRFYQTLMDEIVGRFHMALIGARGRRAMALAVGAAFAVLPCVAGQDAGIRTARRPLRLGETTVDVVISERPGSKHLFCNLHDDDNTAVEAGLVAPPPSRRRRVPPRPLGPP